MELTSILKPQLYSSIEATAVNNSHAQYTRSLQENLYVIHRKKIEITSILKPQLQFNKSNCSEQLPCNTRSLQENL